MFNSESQSPYLLIIARWLFVAIAVFVGTVFGGLGLSNNFLPHTYEATALIQIHGLQEMETPHSSDDLFSEFETIGSPKVLLPVIEQLNLKRVWADRILHSPDELSDDTALLLLHSRLHISITQGTHIIKLTASSDIPPEAALIANGIADEYKTLRDQDDDALNARETEALTDQITQEQKVLEDKKAALVKSQATKSPDTAAAQQNLDQQQKILDALNIRLKQINADMALAEGPVRITSRAEPPTQPAWPNRGMVLLISGLVGTVLALAIASFVEVAVMLTRASRRP